MSNVNIKIGIVARWLSILSNKPPWPGIKFEVSFTSTTLLNKLITASPITETKEEINIKILVFDDLVKKYNINEIEYLFVDTEGYDYKIIKSIDFNKIKINKVKFEYKHLDDTFKFKERLLELKKMFRQLNYRETEIDDENITFEKIVW